MPPPWTRPGWLEMNNGQRLEIMRRYNLALQNHGFGRSLFTPTKNKKFPDGFSKKNINLNFPPLGQEFKRQSDLWRLNPNKEHFSGDFNYFMTTAAPDSERILHETDDVSRADQNLLGLSPVHNPIFSDSTAKNLPSFDETFNIGAGPSHANNYPQIPSPNSDTSSSVSGGASPPKKKHRPGEPIEESGETDQLESPPEEAINTLPTTPPATQIETPGAPVKQPQPGAVPNVVRQLFPAEEMPLPGTGNNMSGIVGGETGPSSFALNVNPSVVYTRTYKKSYKFQLAGNAPANLKTTTTINNITQDQLNLVTNLREMPVHCLGSYMTPGEINEVLSKGYTYALECSVSVGKKSTQAAFETNASESSNAVLNYNKTYKVARGLNMHAWFRRLSIGSYSDTNKGVPDSLKDPVDMNAVFNKAWINTDIGGAPNAITRSVLTIPNVFCQVKPVNNDSGWFDHSIFIKEYDDDDVKKEVYKYNFVYAPLSAPPSSDVIQYPVINVPSAPNVGSIVNTYARANRSRRGVSMKVTGTTIPNSTRKTPRLKTIVNTTLDTLKPVSDITFTYNDIIEKAQWCTRPCGAPFGDKMQPSLHIGIGEVPAQNSFIPNSDVASCFPKSFVPQTGELWVTFELTTITHYPGLKRTNGSIPITTPENTVMTTRSTSWPTSNLNIQPFDGCINEEAA